MTIERQKAVKTTPKDAQPKTVEDINKQLNELPRDKFTGFVKDPKKRDRLMELRFKLNSQNGEVPNL